MIGFIGVGNMGGTLARAAIRAVGAENVLVSSRTLEKAQRFAADTGCTAVMNAETAARAQVLFLGVKPQGMRSMLAEIAPVLQARSDRFVLVSMAAGLSLQQITAFSGGAYPILRIMPNTPAAVGEGMIPYCANELASSEDAAELCRILQPAGRLDPLPEHLIDAAGALSGCGPARRWLMLPSPAECRAIRQFSMQRRPRSALQSWFCRLVRIPPHSRMRCAARRAARSAAYMLWRPAASAPLRKMPSSRRMSDPWNWVNE